MVKKMRYDLRNLERSPSQPVFGPLQSRLKSSKNFPYQASLMSKKLNILNIFGILKTSAGWQVPTTVDKNRPTSNISEIVTLENHEPPRPTFS